MAGNPFYSTASWPQWLSGMHLRLVIRSWAWQHSFIGFDHEIFSTVILSLLLVQEGQLSLSGEMMVNFTAQHDPNVLTGP